VSYEPDGSCSQRGEGQQVSEFDDLGVGRFVARNIVEAHGGTMSDNNDCDQAVIQILLPALAEEDER
jgi:signal transduction histidine kinase